MWKTIGYSYILTDFDKDKFISSYEDICKGNIKELPIIDYFNNKIIFQNGRNRFYHLYKLGYKKIPIYIYKKSLKYFKDIL